MRQKTHPVLTHLPGLERAVCELDHMTYELPGGCPFGPDRDAERSELRDVGGVARRGDHVLCELVDNVRQSPRVTFHLLHLRHDGDLGEKVAKNSVCP
jgi:hypothetical protein